MNTSHFHGFDDLLDAVKAHASKSPLHYPRNQPLGLIRELGGLPGFAQGNALKYITRCRVSPEPTEDLIKAIHYCLILLREAKQSTCDFGDLINEVRAWVSAGPNHYPPQQPLALIRDLGKLLDFAQGNALKYVVRHSRSKSLREDLFKAIHYCLILWRGMLEEVRERSLTATQRGTEAREASQTRRSPVASSARISGAPGTRTWELD